MFTPQAAFTSARAWLASPGKRLRARAPYVPEPRRRRRWVTALLRTWITVGLALLLAGGASPPLQAAASEEQVKAVFLFNFAHFVEWPPGLFASSTQPFVIALAGGGELLPLLEEVVRGESRGGHPFLIQPLQSAAAADAAHLLFIGRDQAPQLPRLLADAGRHGTLIVSDVPGSARRGAMIELVNERNRLRLRINLAAARAAGLTLSSNLLRPAEIVDAEVPPP